jgi:hypothetical protein
MNEQELLVAELLRLASLQTDKAAGFTLMLAAETINELSVAASRYTSMGGVTDVQVKQAIKGETK